MARIPAVERRAALARAALAVIARDGIHAATTRAIVAEAGMPLASFHYAVASREELLRDVVELVVAGEGSATEASLALDAPTIRETARRVLGSYLDLVRADPGREQAMFELTQHALRTPSLSDLPKAQYDAYRGLVAHLMEAGAERHGITWAIPLDTLAGFAVALSDGITLAWLASRDAAAAETALDLAADAIAAHARPTSRPTTSKEQ